MTEISQQIKDAIKGAILLEINGSKFFNHAADVTQHERGRKMFRFLVGHCRIPNGWEMVKDKRNTRCA